MEVTEQWWTLASAGLLLVGLGVLADQLVFLAAAAGLGAWLLGAAITASQSFAAQQRQLTIEYTLATTEIFVDTAAELTLRVSRPPETAQEPIVIDAELPPGISAETESPSVALQAGETTQTTTCTISSSVVGRFEFPPATISIGDRYQLYKVALPYTETPTLTAQPHTPELHIGQGGTGVQSAYGQHRSDRPGPGVTTRELREYVPGDDVQQIDWNATARLGETYVRETEGETDRRTLLIVDHRNRMATGTDGGTMLEYAREVAGGIAQTAAEHGDPLGFRAVGSQGITTQITAGTTPQTYSRIESALYSLQLTAETSTEGTRSAPQARRLATRLDGDTSRFGTVLGAYVGDQTQYVQRFRADPLVSTVRQVHANGGGEGLIVIVTSDKDPVKLQEAVKTAIHGDSRILVFITPHCLFEPPALSDLDALYERYREFEEVRRDLERHPRVSAFEVAPSSRIQQVLAHRQAAAISTQ
ncbi:DUF58 domain-containing protein [Halorubrum sp. SS7]|uniref:DUF58 domain-containing protein n=2 Tax=unclassified Halorubrum TaxID=2642239 RepID=UPI0010F8F066|nr:DUF58 domain-containing protein [Halorubrum sp. SS7]TKX56678.1 DUF58 domain-containing protein [Halorubrum sp. SS7]